MRGAYPAVIYSGGTIKTTGGDAVGGQPQVTLIKDVKTSGTGGGTSTNGTMHTRDLNTITGDYTAMGISLSTNQFTMATAGTYLVEWSAPAMKAADHQTQLYDVTNTAVEAPGGNAYCLTTYFYQTNSVGSAEVTITTSRTFELKHFFGQGLATTGMGQFTASVAGNTNTQEIYAQVKITKVS